METQDFHVAASLIEAECRDKFEKAKTAEDFLKIAFAAAKDHWMYTEEQTQFKGAIGAALIGLKEGPEFDRINKSLRSLRRFSALMNALQAGIPVDFENMEKPDENDSVIPLTKMWHEAKPA